MERDQSLRLLADAQLGLVRRDQLRALGFTRDQVRHRVRIGVLTRVTPSVLRLVGAPVSRRQQALAAVFDAGPGAVLSHASAAAVWGLPGYPLDDLHVMRRRSRCRRETNLATVHEPVLLLDGHCVHRGALPVTTPSRTLFDLASLLHPDRLARTVDDALVLRLTNTRALHEMLQILAARGRTGITAMREVLADRGPDDRPPERHLEARVQTLLAGAGIGPLERQVDVGDVDGWIARVDFLYRPYRLIIFVDGDRWHSTLTDRAADAQQQARLERAGYVVVRVTEAMVFRGPATVVAAVRCHLPSVRWAG